MKIGPRSGAVKRRRRFGAVFVAAVVTPLTVLAPPVASPVVAAAADLFISEYIEGSSNNKAIEIANATGAAVDLAADAYNIQMFFNGSAASTLTINLAGTVADGDVYVIAQATADPVILAVADLTNGSGWFNGDDAVVLRKGTTVLDVVGQIGFDPGSEWGTGLTSTADNTLQRLPSICQGDTDGSNTFDPATEWAGLATNSFDGLGAHVSDCGGSGGDAAPAVSATAPVNGASSVAREANLTVTFTEDVDVTGAWFSITCSTSGSHSAIVSGGPSTFVLDPDVDFTSNETCTVTVVAANVTDQDGVDPPDTMAADTAFSFTTVDNQVCGDPATAIHDIQGTGLSSPMNGATNVTIEGIVVNDLQASNQFSGYHLQEQDGDADADPLTSEGIFVFNSSFPVSAGDLVRVRGNITEFTTTGVTLTEMVSVTSVLICATGQSVAPTPVELPVASVSDWERYEGMAVTLPQTLTVTETFTLARFGEVSLSVGGRLYTPTNVVDPGGPALALQDLNNRSRIVLDDGNGQQNIDPTLYPAGGLSAANPLRSGDTTVGVTGVLEQRFGLYRIQPTAPVTFTSANPRPTTPADVGGSVTVASMNVLNYFNGDGLGGGFPTSRGAETALELGRQEAKIVAALAEMDADVIGLMEIENDSGPLSAVAQLTAALNAAVGANTYAYVDTGVIGTDEIRVAIIYRPGSVTPVGAFDTLTSADDPTFIDTLNRPALAQTFSQNANGQRLTVVVNHLKSKGSDCNAVGDPDLFDGQGNCNVTRTMAATALANWLATDPTGSGDPDFLIIGDLNSYAKEDPIKALEANGYTNLIAELVGPSTYSYVFDGQSGYLDHALATAPLTAQVTGVTEWHINADEAIALDYNTNFKTANQIDAMYAPDAFRSSDHDPVIVGICQSPTLSVSVNPKTLILPLGQYRTIKATPTASADVSDVTLLSVTSSEPDNAPGLWDGHTVNDIVVIDDLTVKVRSERNLLGPGRTYTFTYQATNDCGATVTATATVTVPRWFLHGVS